MINFSISYEDAQKLQMSLWARKDKCRKLVEILETLAADSTTLKVTEYKLEIEQLEDLEVRLVHSMIDSALPKSK